MSLPTKTCLRCKRELATVHFNKYKRDGYQRWCKYCALLGIQESRERKRQLKLKFYSPEEIRKQTIKKISVAAYNRQKCCCRFCHKPKVDGAIFKGIHISGLGHHKNCSENNKMKGANQYARYFIYDMLSV